MGHHDYSLASEPTACCQGATPIRWIVGKKKERKKEREGILLHLKTPFHLEGDVCHKIGPRGPRKANIYQEERNGNTSSQANQ